MGKQFNGTTSWVRRAWTLATKPLSPTAMFGVMFGVTFGLFIGDCFWGGVDYALEKLPVRAAVAAALIVLFWIKYRRKTKVR